MTRRLKTRAVHTLLASVWPAALVGLLALLTHASAATGGWPPTQSPAAVLRWLHHVEPVVVGFTLVRVGAVLTTGYLLVTTVLTLAAHRSDRPALAHAAHRVTLPAVARLARRSASIGLTASVVVTAGPALGRSTGEPARSPAPTTTPEHPAADDMAVTMVLLDDDTPTRHRPVDSPDPDVTQRQLPDSPPDTREGGEPPSSGLSSPPTPTEAEAEPAPAAGPTTPPPTDDVAGTDRSSIVAPAEATWTIVAGEHLWAVAADTLRDHWPSPPSDTEIAGYLEEVIATNRTRLVDPDNPDLVYPGQVFDLPPVPAAPTTDQPW